MTIWKNRLSLLGGEEELMKYPPHIRRAFCCVGVYENEDSDFSMAETGIIQPYYGDFIRENVRRFIQRWGGLDNATLLRVLKEDTGIDRLKVLFAIGYSSMPKALDTVTPYLESTNRLERCAVACVMGMKRDKQALTVLEDYYLHDAIDTQGTKIPEAEGWYETYYAVLALILANWGPPEMTVVLHCALKRILSPEHKQSIGHDHYAPTNLCYALGRRGDFSIFQEITLSPRERYMALFSLAAGYLNAYERYENFYWAVKENENLQGEIKSVWRERFGLSDQEIEECFAMFHPKLFESSWLAEYEDK